MQHDHPKGLPRPDATSAAHSARVADYIRGRIEAAGGAIGFADYMRYALYAPGLGYYSAGATRFGAAGDFVTAPEVSSLFAQVLARQVAQVLVELEAPEVLEFGAGSGRLALDLLRKLEELGALPAAYRILDVSADLRARQRELFEAEAPTLLPRVSWLDAPPANFTGAVVANEVLDALPVSRFRRGIDDVVEICVAVRDGGFELVERAAPAELTGAVLAIEADLGQRLEPGYAGEVCLAAPAWIATLADCLRRGSAFLFDYGLSRRELYASDRSGGWLRCHFRHHAHDDPLVLAGIQDITSWVDFSAVAQAAAANGLRVDGYTTQAHFLLHGGLDAELAKFAEMPPAAQLELSAQVKTLTLPGEMGENFKCLVVSRGVTTIPAAIAATDRAATL